MHCAIATNALVSSRLHSQRLDDTPPPACSKRLRSQLVEGTTLSLQNKGCKISVNLVKTFRCTDSNSLQTLNFQSKSQKCARSFLHLFHPSPFLRLRDWTFWGKIKHKEIRNSKKTPKELIHRCFLQNCLFLCAKTSNLHLIENIFLKWSFQRICTTSQAALIMKGAPILETECWSWLKVESARCRDEFLKHIPCLMQ